jgi:hypothetical protein
MNHPLLIRLTLLALALGIVGCQSSEQIPDALKGPPPEAILFDREEYETSSSPDSKQPVIPTAQPASHADPSATLPPKPLEQSNTPTPATPPTEPSAPTPAVAPITPTQPTPPSESPQSLPSKPSPPQVIGGNRTASPTTEPVIIGGDSTTTPGEAAPSKEDLTYRELQQMIDTQQIKPLPDTTAPRDFIDQNPDRAFDTKSGTPDSN